MAIKLSGLVSGMDTDAMIEELVSAYSTRKDKVFKQRKTVEYKQEAWAELNKKIYGFYTGSLSNMKLSSNYSLKKVSSSNEKCASITGDANAVNGTQELKINQLAKTGYLTGAKIAASKTQAVLDADGKAVLDDDGKVKMETVEVEATEATTLKSLGIEKDATIFVNVNGETKKVKLDTGMTLKELDAELSDLGLNVNFDEHNQRFFISSKKSGEEGDFSLLATDKDSMNALNKLGLSTMTENTAEAYEQYAIDNNGNLLVTDDEIQFAKDMAAYIRLSNKKADELTADEITELGGYKTTYGDIANKGATKIDGQDAKIELNGAEFVSTSNTFQINGLTINAKAVTDEDEIVTITTDTDVDAIYNKIKDFLKEYNELMTEMYTKYNAESAGDYEPLTEEEEEELSETQIEKWEKILSTAALRRDSTLSSVMSSMRTAMSQSYEINGKSYSLSSFGIATLGYFNSEDNEKANFHIDGDVDDENTSTKADKLRKAIVEDPEATVEFFSSLMKGLYKAVDEKMAKSTETKSAFKIYNDKALQKQYDSYTDKLDDWEDKIEAYRERFEKKFSNMEVAMSKLQSQTSAMASFFGISQ